MKINFTMLHIQDDFVFLYSLQSCYSIEAVLIFFYPLRDRKI